MYRLARVFLKMFIFKILSNMSDQKVEARKEQHLIQIVKFHKGRITAITLIMAIRCDQQSMLRLITTPKIKMMIESK